MSRQESNTTKDHEKIRRWAEERGGIPSSVEGTESGDAPGVLRIDFPGRGEDAKMRHISWDDFFEKFDEADLTFLYQDKTADGQISRFSKFIRQEGDSGRYGSRDDRGDRDERGQRRE